VAYADSDKKRANGRKWARLWYEKNREKKLAYEAARRAAKQRAPKAEKKTHEILRTLGAGRALQGSGEKARGNPQALLEEPGKVSGKGRTVARREPRTKA